MSKSWSKLKIAIVHDWLINSGGAERHLAAVAELFPNSPIYVSAWRPSASLEFFQNRDVYVGWPGRLPLLGRYHRLGVFFRYLYWLGLKLDDYDLVISSSGSEAKVVKTKPGQLHVNICYTPPHYYWSHYRQHLRSPGLGLANWPARIVLFLFIKPLRALDLWAARRPDKMIAISNAVSGRMKCYYGRDSHIIFPPVDSPPKIPNQVGSRQGYVVLGRHVPYKNLDLAVLACRQTSRPLTVIGSGPDSRRLKRLAKGSPMIKFVGQVSEEQKYRLLAQAKACIFPGVDDFGMVMVEALSVGTPVVALAGGGALDIVSPTCGVFFDRPTTDSLIGGLNDFENSKISSTACRRQASRFSKKVFQTEFDRYLKQVWKDFDGGTNRN